MIRKIIKYSFFSFASLLLLLAIIVIWLIWGSGKINFISSYIEDQFVNSFPEYILDIKDHSIKFNVIDNDLSIKANNIIIKDQENKILKINNISIKYDFYNLMKFKYYPKSLYINGVETNIDINHILSNEKEIEENIRSKNDFILSKVNYQKLYQILFDIMNNIGISQDHNINLERFSINNAVINMSGKGSYNESIKINKVTGNVVISSDNDIVIVMDVNAQIKGKSISFANEILLDKDNIITNKISFTDMSFSSIAEQIPQDLLDLVKGINKSKFTASGGLRFFLSENQGIEHIEASISSNKGVIFLDKLFDEGIDFDKLNISCSINNNFIKYDCQEFNINVGNNNLSGGFSTEFVMPEIISHISLKTDNLEVSSLADLWPKITAKTAREWIDVNIFDGTIKNATADFEIRKNVVFPSSKTVASNTDINIDIESAKVKYHKDGSHFSDIDAIVKINNKEIIAEVKSAKLKGNIIKDTIVTIPDYKDKENFQLLVKGYSEGAIKDYAEIINKYIAKPIDVMGNSLENIAGNLKGNFDLEIPLNIKNIHNIKYLINADLDNLYIPNVIDNIAVNNGKLELIINNNKIEAKGKVYIYDIEGEIFVVKNISDNKDELYKFKTYASIDKISNIIKYDIPYIKGYAAVDIDTYVTDNKVILDIKSDLKDSIINIEEIDFIKNSSVDFNADIKAVLTESDLIEIKDISIKADNVDIKGRAEFNKDNIVLHELILDKLQLNDNELDLLYKNNKNNNNNIEIISNIKNIDLSKIDLYKLIFSRGNETNRSRNISIKANKVNLKNDIVFYDFISQVNCSSKECRKIDISSSFNKNNKFNIYYGYNENNIKVLNIKADNVGDILKALEISNKMDGGSLDIKAKQIISETGEKYLDGNISVWDFTLVKTPILAKILTLASLSGVLDMLNGKGIEFKKFYSNFTYKNNILNLKEGKGHGSSIGITISGDINTESDSLKLSGTVIPAYIVNRAIGEIPIVGDILTGGKEGGIVAVKYYIKGTLQEPIVTVNPLSILTPGFLRGVFDIVHNVTNSKTVYN